MGNNGLIPAVHGGCNQLPFLPHFNITRAYTRIDARVCVFADFSPVLCGQIIRYETEDP